MKRICAIWWKLPDDYREIICILGAFGIALGSSWLIVQW